MADPKAEHSDQKARIMGLIQRRDKLQANVQRIQGRLDSAKADLVAAEDECRTRKVDPAKIDDVIAQLSTKLKTETEALEAKIATAETKILPFLKED